MRALLAAVGLTAALAACGGVSSGAFADGAAPQAKTDSKEAKETKALLGKWKVKAIRKEGKDAVDKAPDITMTLLPEGKVEGDLPNGSFKATYRLEVESTPKQLDIKHETGPYAGEPQFCSYKLDGDLLILIATHPGAEASDRPVDFETEQTFVFERVKEAK